MPANGDLVPAGVGESRAPPGLDPVALLPGRLLAHAHVLHDKAFGKLGKRCRRVRLWPAGGHGVARHKAGEVQDAANVLLCFEAR